MKIYPLSRMPRLGVSLHHQLLRVLAAIALVYFLFHVGVASAQDQVELPSYWQHSTSGRLRLIQTADVNLDGVDEFLLVDDNDRIDLISASGKLLWSFVAPNSVFSLDVVNLSETGQPRPGIVIGMPNQLLLLSAEGEEIWRTAIRPLDIQSSLSGVEESPDGEVQIPRSATVPLDIIGLDSDNEGQSTILVLLESGELILLDTNGKQIWRHADHSSEDLTFPPKVLTSDLDLDGQDEIILSVFNPRRFGQLVLIDDGRVMWDLSLSRSITDLQEIRFGDDSQPLVAVSTTSGHVQIYDYLRRRHWMRTLNTPATSLAEIRLPDQTILAVGTDTGMLTAFDEQGRRLWTSHLADEADRPVLALASAPTVNDESEPVLAAILEAKDDRSSADIFLMDGRGKITAKINNVETRNLAQFVDSNYDQNSELLVPRFATLELLGMGVGNTGNVLEWEYSLNAAPGAALVTDLNKDGIDELIIGTLDGRVHSLNNNRSINWLFDAGGAIQALAVLNHLDGSDSSVIVAGNNESDVGDISGWIQLREARGERIWEHNLESQISALTVADVVRGGDSEIVAGTLDGNVVVLSSLGEILLELSIFPIEQSVNHLAFIVSDSHPAGEIIVAGQNRIVALNIANPDTPARFITSYSKEISGLYGIEEQGNQELDVRLIVATTDGLLHGLDANGIEMSQWNWPVDVGAEMIAGFAEPDISDPELLNSQFPLLLGTETGEILRLDIVDDRPLQYWAFQGPRNVTDVHWYDKSADGNPDTVVVGNQQGNVMLFEKTDTTAPIPATDPLQFTSAIFNVDSLNRDVSPIPDLLVIGENGLVQLYRNQENRPPLLTNPEVKAELGQYSVSISVNDIEGDEVIVSLELQDSESGEWFAQDTQQLGDGVGTLFWALPSPPESPDGLGYRFAYSDGFHSGTMTPPPGPPPLVASPWSNAAPLALLAITVTGLILGVVYVRQAQTPTARASRIFQQMRENPSQTLVLLEEQINFDNPPNLIPHIGSHARQADDRIVANLADGLFILPEQPLSGVPILNQVLDDITKSSDRLFIGHWRWTHMCRTSQALLEAPSVTELSLLTPQLEQLRVQLESDGNQLQAFHLLSPILSNLRDSERVDLAEDRLVYLNEAGVSLTQTKKQLPVNRPSLEYLLVSAIVRRWSGLVSAEIEDLQGRAELVVTLKTRRLVPSENTAVALEIQNSGRAAAENLVAVLDENPAFSAHIDRQQIVYLPPGRSREIHFSITPKVSDRFRIGMTVTFTDRNDENRTTAFGDMVHMLPPVRDFSSIVNPYTPGTPLRQDSLLFFGREDLFEFIAENAGHRSYRNVLILVGQRRTGKTSALLRLEDHLPLHLLPVYIDCQSLGVVPGMPSLLEELAWYISDALSRRGVEAKVPELSAWQQDPTRLFQRQFLPYVNSLLPEGTTLLLVFDEFEAFETLVTENILPATFFTYLRHLMQHSEQLNFIFVGTRRLEEMTSDYWSVLFNIALYRKIDFLDVAAAMRLITEPVSPNLIYDDLALDKIMRVTAGHPYFLQLVCYTLVKHANIERSGYVTISNVNAAVDEMLSLGEVHFAYLWQRSTMAERAILATVAHLMDHTLPFHPEELIQRLEPYDIQLDPTELTGALTSLVERDIMREVTEEAKSLFEMKLGLVSLWVAKNKSLSKLYAGNGSRTNGRPRGEPVQST